MSYFIYANLISSLLVLRLVDPGSTLIHVCAFGLKMQVNIYVKIFGGTKFKNC